MAGASSQVYKYVADIYPDFGADSVEDEVKDEAYCNCGRPVTLIRLFVTTLSCFKEACVGGGHLHSTIQLLSLSLSHRTLV